MLDAAQQTRVALAVAQHGVSEVTIYEWRKRYAKNGPAGLEDQRKDNSGAKSVPDWKRAKVLAIKETDPGFGQFSNAGIFPVFRNECIERRIYKWIIYL